MSLGGMVAAPAMQLIYALLSGFKNQRGTNEANAANEARFNIGTQLGLDALRGGMATYDADAQNTLNTLNQIFGQGHAGAKNLQESVGAQLAGRTRNVLGAYDRANQGYATGLSDFLNSFNSDAAGITQGYRDRYKTAANDLAGYGDQQKADINEQFDTLAKQTQSNLANRGFANSTAGAGVDARMGRERSAELRRLGDDLTRQRVGILSGLSGDTLSAQERLANQGAGYKWGGLGQMFQNNANRANLMSGLSGDQINAYQQLGNFMLQNDAANQQNIANFYGTNAANRSNMWTSGLNNLQNWFGARTDAPPPPNNLPFSFGQSSVQAPSPPSGWSQFMAAFGGPAGTALGGLGASRGFANAFNGLTGGMFSGGGGLPSGSYSGSAADFGLPPLQGNWSNAVYPN